MYIRFRRTVHPIEFLKRYAKPHIIVGHYDPLDHRDENGIGPVTYRIALGIVMNTLDLAGECTDMIDPEACTLNLMFERADNAAKVCRLVQATPAKALADSASRAEFFYDHELFERIRPLRDARMAAIRAASMATSKQSEGEDAASTATGDSPLRPNIACSRSACSVFVGNPVDGPPRCTSTISSGSSVITANPMASDFSDTPGPDVLVTPSAPP